MGPDDFADLGLCPDCDRDMTAGEPHTADCPLALEQDARDNGGSAADIAEAVYEWGDVMADAFADIGAALTCREYEATLRVLTVAGIPTASLTLSHALEDDEGDDHFTALPEDTA